MNQYDTSNVLYSLSISQEYLFWASYREVTACHVHSYLVDTVLPLSSLFCCTSWRLTGIYRPTP